MFKFLLSFFSLAVLPSVAFAEVDPETAYILNSLSFLMHGFIVMLMAAGFCMLESGLKCIVASASTHTGIHVQQVFRRKIKGN